MNQAQIIGRLTKDPETKYTSQTQTAVVEETVAVNRIGKKDEADFIRVKIFGNQAEALTKFCKKGSLVGIVGRIETSSYTGKDGETKYKTEIIASNVDFLSWEHSQGNKGKADDEDWKKDNPADDFKQIESDFPF